MIDVCSDLTGHCLFHLETCWHTTTQYTVPPRTAPGKLNDLHAGDAFSCPSSQCTARYYRGCSNSLRSSSDSQAALTATHWVHLFARPATAPSRTRRHVCILHRTT
ncbi:hypothetical protein PsYK624_124260 [Phanerochaete sordida]|uniref:Uncharacterized protein n=1 Tax=Phanerochaete sordida TaxID=48140 RepID=A0A9P3GIK5_9APHY|nr:hypothetical protein PsYK624_124260 [Phanerochaete sordida]